jgi:hypothetical protein
MTQFITSTLALTYDTIHNFHITININLLYLQSLEYALMNSNLSVSCARASELPNLLSLSSSPRPLAAAAVVGSGLCRGHVLV